LPLDKEETTLKKDKKMKKNSFAEGVLLGFAIGTLAMSLIYSIVISKLDDKHYREIEKIIQTTENNR
jgi:sulfite exporter TauE/SafE